MCIREPVHTPRDSLIRRMNLAQPTFWNTYRWTFVMPADRFNTLHKCAQKFRLLASNDPEMDLLSTRDPQWHIQKLDGQSYEELYGAPDLGDVRFSTRTLIEGLIAHGILKPGEVSTLLQTLKIHAVVVAFQDRILESLYNEERIRNIQSLVRGESRHPVGIDYSQPKPHSFGEHRHLNLHISL